MILTCAMVGCTSPGESMGPEQVAQMTGSGATANRVAQLPGEDAQTAYRRELLGNQLRHAQLDLESASDESERESLQERIDVIQHMLASLDQK